MVSSIVFAKQDVKLGTTALFCMASFSAVTENDQTPSPLFALGGIHLFPYDVITIALIVVSVVQRKQLWRNLRPWLVVMLALLPLLMVSVVVGYVKYGNASLVEFRPFAYFMAAIVAFASIEWSDSSVRRLALLTTLAASGAIVIIAVARLMDVGFVSSDEFFIDVTGTYRTLRPVVASQAAVLGSGSIVALAAWIRSGKVGYVFSWIVLTSVVVVVQHRSVWIATFFGIVTLAVISRGRAISTRFVAAIVCWLSFATLLYLTGALDLLLDKLSTSFADVFSARSTVTNRTSGWDLLTDELFAQNSAASALGLPMGHGYARIGPSGLIETYQPHNWYVQLLLRVGVLGVTCFVVAVLLAARDAWTVRESRLHFALIAFVSVFVLAYGFIWYLAPFFVFGACVVGRGCESEGGGALQRSYREHSP
ncbi:MULTISPECIES: hypothetical protein [unclassified Rhodococcus (in: high G+C Gram-positive bacteria)]|uniref:hypothetical protein n=1 Tax=unclassified Rhodococcus (in: high G+C Gram-positive bacteria) TaxID=192944 RepID=UPI00163AEF20|nr:MULTISPECIES: hypothetical protein [unclassified Rhodococcus (in: high G+C Gram-positive bacteria)]MBC2642717.1 hypothetical protein [Rhodococcus sp. 3A]MBC2892541.1 hypothetical protein [Rhodococcus sp. 4CII]